MPYTPKQMSVAAVGTSDTLLYTAPAGGAIIKEITVTNTTATAATLTLGFPAAGALAATNYFLGAQSFAANSETTFPLSQVLTNAQTIRALQGTSAALVVHISGIEIS